MTESAADELLREIQKELAPQPCDIVLDLSQLEAMSAGALAYLFRIQKAAFASAHRLVLVGTPEPVERFFRTTKVRDALELVASQDEALAGATAAH
jgi:anti-anti-sigma factor